MRRIWVRYDRLPPAAQLAVLAVVASPLLIVQAWPGPAAAALLVVPFAAGVSRWAWLNSSSRT